MSFSEVPVHEMREVLRLWLRREGQRSIARLAALDHKTEHWDVLQVVPPESANTNGMF